MHFKRKKMDWLIKTDFFKVSRINKMDKDNLSIGVKILEY